ncbi:hypothetical protein PWT90_00736 [Aphanocladium album]|nr:hypothetical protein PWT90_00736 [Aphanocladium album]
MALSNETSLRLALDLQLRDVEELLPKKKGCGRKRKATDFDIALGEYEKHLAAEIQAVGGRLPAPLDVARPRKRAATRKSAPSSPDARVNLPRHAKSTALRAIQTTTPPAQDSSTHNASGVLASTNELQCAICLEPPLGGFVSTCVHVYCATCVGTFFANATNDEAIFPPRCCGTPILLENARDLLPVDVVTRFEKKQIEFGTPNRRYCHGTNCGEFLDPADFAGDRCQCSTCQAWACILCRAAAHDGVCPNDALQNEVRTMAVQRGWKPCPACGNLVEKNQGCNHICECNVLLSVSFQNGGLN